MRRPRPTTGGPGRVVYLSQSEVPSRYANSVHVMRMCEAIGRHAAATTLIARRGTNAAEPFEYYGTERTFSLVHARWPRWRGGAWLYALASLRHAMRADLVYGRSVRGCYLASLFGRPIIFEAHIDSAHWPAHERAMLVRLMGSPSLVGVVVISQPLQRHFVETYRLPAEKVLVAGDAAASPVSESTDTARGSERLQVGYVGHLYPGRGIELITALASRCQWADFHVVGGMEADVTRWRETTTGLGNLTFHGFVPPARTDSVRAGFDVALAPYQQRVTIAGRTDTTDYMSPLKLFEYMAARLCIICADLPVLREVMRPEVNCLMCPPDDVPAWANALVRVAEDAALRTRLADAGHADFVARHSWDARMERILRHFGMAARHALSEEPTSRRAGVTGDRGPPTLAPDVIGDDPPADP